MTFRNRILLAAALALCVVPPVVAQEAPAAPEAPRAPEAEQALREAEARLQEAAKEVARLSREIAPGRFVIREEFLSDRSRPRLGLSLATEEYTDDSGKTDKSGIKILGVSPGSAADEAGVRAGDVLIGFQGEDLRKRSAGEAVELIAKGLGDAEVGDRFGLRVERDGKVRDLDLTLNDASFGPGVFAFSTGPGEVEVEVRERARMNEMRAREMAERALALGERGPHAERFVFLSSSSPWASMELVELTPRLGQYFKTDEGLLVVRAPEDASLGFEDGDVIREIGGRTPTDVGHAMRILRSYAKGETLEVAIVRDGRKRKLEIEVPETVGSTLAPKVWHWDVEAELHEAPQLAN